MGVHLRSNYSNLTAKTNGMENKFKTKKKTYKNSLQVAIYTPEVSVVVGGGERLTI